VCFFVISNTGRSAVICYGGGVAWSSWAYLPTQTKLPSGWTHAAYRPGSEPARGGLKLSPRHVLTSCCARNEQYWVPSSKFRLRVKTNAAWKVGFHFREISFDERLVWLRLVNRFPWSIRRHLYDMLPNHPTKTVWS